MRIVFYPLLYSIFFPYFFFPLHIQSYLKTLYATVELCNSKPANEQNMVQYHLTQTPRKIVFKGLAFVYLVFSFIPMLLNKIETSLLNMRPPLK